MSKVKSYVNSDPCSTLPTLPAPACVGQYHVAGSNLSTGSGGTAAMYDDKYVELYADSDYVSPTVVGGTSLSWTFNTAGSYSVEMEIGLQTYTAANPSLANGGTASLETTHSFAEGATIKSWRIQALIHADAGETFYPQIEETNGGGGDDVDIYDFPKLVTICFASSSQTDIPI